jgi:hypothetical protein
MIPGGNTSDTATIASTRATASSSRTTTPPTSTNYHPHQRNMSSAMLCYPHNELTALAGPPTADNLRVMIDELVANTSAITTSLGGRQHGHSGLVLTDTETAALTTPAPAPFIVPAPPTTPALATMAALVAADPNMMPSIQMMLYELEKATVDTAVRVECHSRSHASNTSASGAAVDCQPSSGTRSSHCSNRRRVAQVGGAAAFTSIETALADEAFAFVSTNIAMLQDQVQASNVPVTPATSFEKFGHELEHLISCLPNLRNVVSFTT